jgi:hypothetical protein
MTIRVNAIVSEGELNTILQEMHEKSQQMRLNAYEIYIEECKLHQTAKVDAQGKPLRGVEKHHIIPRFDGGTNKPENIVFLTVKEHVIAHWLRWKVLGKSQDYSAFLFRIGDTEEALELRRQAVIEARERDRINQHGFFNREFQRDMGKRGGSKGGAQNTEAQFCARQKVGLAYGRETGLGNQGEILSEFVAKFSIWAYSAKAATEKRGAIRDDEQFYLVSPKQAFADITKVLNTFVPNSVTNSASMHKLVYGERPQMYGWRIVRTLIRSEVREGIHDFINENPICQFDENLMEIEGLE